MKKAISIDYVYPEYALFFPPPARPMAVGWFRYEMMKGWMLCGVGGGGWRNPARCVVFISLQNRIGLPDSMAWHGPHGPHGPWNADHTTAAANVFEADCRLPIGHCLYCQHSPVETSLRIGYIDYGLFSKHKDLYKFINEHRYSLNRSTSQC